MRQTVRLNEVRAPDAPQDGLTPAQVLGTDQAALTLDVHYDGVLTQLRNILGTPTWRDAPGLNLADAALGQAQVQAAQAAQAATLAQQGQQIALLLSQAQDLAALKTQVGYIRTGLVNLSAQAATKDALAALADDVGRMDAALSQRVAQVTAQVAVLANQQATDHTRIDALEAQTGNYVTASGLMYALRTAYIMDAPLRGARNAANLVFTVDTPFVSQTLRVHLNGQALRAGPAGDYVVVSEGDGVPSKTIRFLHAAAAPYAQDVLTATYIPASV